MKDCPVTLQNGPRPAGKPDECFYCRQPLGEQHLADCVLRKRTVVVEMKFTVLLDVVESWDAARIEFHRNEGTYCASNDVNYLYRTFGEDMCACFNSEVTYLREPTEDDMKNLGPIINEETE